MTLKRTSLLKNKFFKNHVPNREYGADGKSSFNSKISPEEKGLFSFIKKDDENDFKQQLRFRDKNQI